MDFFFFSSRRRHTRLQGDWSSDVCSSDLAAGVSMSRGKAIQDGVRVKLPAGVTWDALAKLTPDEVRDKGAFPAGFMPLPHPNHPEGGMVFPAFQINEVKRQTGRDLTRFDLDFDLPDAFLPEFPAPIYLTTRPDLGDVSRGRLVTTDNRSEEHTSELQSPCNL